MMSDYEYYRFLLKKVDGYPDNYPGNFTHRQVTLAKNSVKILMSLARSTVNGLYDPTGIALQAMLDRDPRFYDAVMERLEKDEEEEMVTQRHLPKMREGSYLDMGILIPSV